MSFKWFEMSGTLLDINQTGKNSGVEQRSIDRVCLACVSKVAASNMSQKRISDFFKDGGGQKAKEKKSSNDGRGRDAFIIRAAFSTANANWL